MKLNLRDPLFWVMHGIAAAALAVALYVVPASAQVSSGFGVSAVPRSGGTFVGPVTNTGQPTFRAYLSAQVDNITGNNTTYTVAFNAKVYDYTSSFNTANGTFTAPVDGKYRFATALDVSGLTASATTGEMRIVASNRSSVIWRGNIGAVRTGAGADSLIAGYAEVDMDAGDTATVTIAVNGLGADTADVYGDGTGIYTWFTGGLVN